MNKSVKYFFSLIILLGVFFSCGNSELSNQEVKERGERFLLKNKNKEGIKVTSSSLQYKVIKEGVGVKPNATSTVEVLYKGTFINGDVFDSTSNPISFPLNRVIPGWTEGLQLMTVGSKYTFYIPYQLAYGERGNNSIPGYSALIFDVELLAVK